MPRTVTQFERLVHRHQDRVYSYARCYLSSEADAQDVTQEVFLRLWHHVDGVEEDRVLHWLLRVARNACIDVLRSRRSGRALFVLESDGLDDLLDLGPGPDTDCEHIDFQDLLRRALERMGEPYRSILILREIQDLKYEDISEALDLPLNTVKVYLHRARKALRDRLGVTEYRENA